MELYQSAPTDLLLDPAKATAKVPINLIGFDDNDSDSHCQDMIVFQVIVFILFYVSLLVIIICMCCKY